MKFIVEIEVGNDAVQTPRDVAKLLEGVATKLRANHGEITQFYTPIMDTNGNKVGSAEIPNPVLRKK